jgi:SAM-dependent methyltransferase
VSALGRRVFRITTDVGIANAVRERSRAISREIEEMLLRGRAIRVASLACGHCRELDHLSSAQSNRLDIWANDQDALTVEHLRAKLQSSRHQVVQATVGAILKGTEVPPPSDLVYASGLFDYLDDRVGSMLLARMAAALRPGGRVIIANLTPDNEEIAFMEAVMDWWMIYRSPNDLRNLAACLEGTEGDFTAETYASAEGRVAWLVVTRSGHPDANA